MKKLSLLLVISLLMATIACNPIEQQARDTSAALSGAITAAQTKYLDSCKANPAQSTCQTINKSISGENALITATEAYCGWSTNSPPPDPTTKCVPVATAQDGLKTAIANANTFIAQLKGVL